VFRALVLFAFGLCVLGPPSSHGQAHPTHSESRSNPALEQFKSLLVSGKAKIVAATRSAWVTRFLPVAW